MTAEAVVIVPGLLGSELSDADGRIWPPGFPQVLGPYPYLDRLGNPDLVVGGIIRRVAILNQYQDLVDLLEDCGFHEGDALFTFPYDWRKDAIATAGLLADAIDRIAARFGHDVEIALVAHSMGATIARSCLEDPRNGARAGVKCVKRLVMLAPPHRGVPYAMAGALGREKHGFLSGPQMQQLSRHPEFPTLYQAMPPRTHPYFWNTASGARLAPFDPFDRAIAPQLGLVQANIDAADRFYAMLDLARRPAHVRYFSFVGTHEATITEYRAELRGAQVSSPDSVERDNGGDGRVPVWSGCAQGVQCAEVGGEHGTIYKDAMLQQLLPEVLGRGGVAPPAPVQVSLKSRLLAAGDASRMTLRFGHDASPARGTVRIVREMDASGERAEAPVSSFGVAHGGAGLRQLVAHFDAPREPGGYRVEFVPEGASAAVAAAHLIVQRPGAK